MKRKKEEEVRDKNTGTERGREILERKTGRDRREILERKTGRDRMEILEQDDRERQERDTGAG